MFDIFKNMFDNKSANCGYTNNKKISKKRKKSKSGANKKSYSKKSRNIRKKSSKRNKRRTRKSIASGGARLTIKRIPYQEYYK